MAVSLVCFAAGFPSSTIVAEAKAEDTQPRLIPGKRAESLGPLGAEAALIKNHWESKGELTYLPPFLLQRGEKKALRLPSKFLEEGPGQCVSVVLISSSNNSFQLHFPQHPQAPLRRAWPRTSSVGLAEITRCDARRSLLRDLHVTMLSPRGVFQVVALLSPQPPTKARALLETRRRGASAPSPPLGPAPSLPPLIERIHRQEKKFLERQAHHVQLQELTTNEEGESEAIVELEAGCHEFIILADETNIALDLDAALYLLPSRRRVLLNDSRGRSTRLNYCVGSPTRTILRTRGAQNARRLVLLLGTWNIPAQLPLNWGTEARARLAHALGATPAMQVTPIPIDATLGVRGRTIYSIPTDPGRCYVAAVILLQGEASNLALKTRRGLEQKEATAPPKQLGTSVQFCGQQSYSEIEVTAQGSGLQWLAAIWPIERPSLWAQGD
ncbi:MAG: hypothetical protein MK135_09490 [Polyangiaceae bacterium]|nr:hypothetical protein [Polyangiaceae bacterium]